MRGLFATATTAIAAAVALAWWTAPGSETVSTVTGPRADLPLRAAPTAAASRPESSAAPLVQLLPEESRREPVRADRLRVVQVPLDVLAEQIRNPAIAEEPYTGGLDWDEAGWEADEDVVDPWFFGEAE